MGYARKQFDKSKSKSKSNKTRLKGNKGNKGNREIDREIARGNYDNLDEYDA
jgi:hypothetical protein